MVATAERAPVAETPVRVLEGEGGVVPPVLVALDGSELAERALPYAAGIARERGARLVLVRVVELYPHGMAGLSVAALGGVLLPIEREAAATYLAEQTEQLRERMPALAVEAELRLGDPGQELLDAERCHGAQLLVLTTHGRTGVSRWLRGSVAEKVLRYGQVPVLLVRPWDTVAGLAPPAPAGEAGDVPAAHRRVVVGLDGSEMGEGVLPSACRLAGSDAGAAGDSARSPAEVVVAMVVPPRAVSNGYTAHGSLAQARDAAHAYLEGVAVRLRHRGVVAWPVVLVAEDVAGALAELAINVQADLIALSTHGRGGLGRWIYGSVTDRVAHVARVPVLLFRPAAAMALRNPSAAGAAAG